MLKIIQNAEQLIQELGKKLEKESDLEFIKKLYKKFTKTEIYLVGGAVRDRIMGRETSKDYDFVVRGVGAAELAVALQELGKVDLVGARFGVFKFTPQGSDEEAIDIALPRREIAFGTGGYRDFDTQSDPSMPIEDDLGRRDFTWNALAYELRSRRLVDPFGGVRDLEARIVRAIRDPEKRFREDYSRMLRALRFAVVFDFSLDAKTHEAIKLLGDHINDEIKRDDKSERIVPYEVAAREFLKALSANSVRAIELYEDVDMLHHILPELQPMKGCDQMKEWHSEGDVWTHTKIALAALESEDFRKFFGGKKPSPEVIFATLLHDIGKPETKKTPERDGVDRVRFHGHDTLGAEIAREICERLRVNSVPKMNVETDRIVWLVRHHLFTLNTNLVTVRKTTLERYFFRDESLGESLLELTFADGSASIPKGGKPDLSNLIKVMELIKELRRLKKEHPELPKPLLNGEEIMETLKLKPGPKVGKVILELREAQLSGKISTKDDAAVFIENLKS